MASRGYLAVSTETLRPLLNVSFVLGITFLKLGVETRVEAIILVVLLLSSEEFFGSLWCLYSKDFLSRMKKKFPSHHYP